MYNYDYYYIYKAWIIKDELFLAILAKHVDMISMDTPPLAQSAFFWYELAFGFGMGLLQIQSIMS